MKIFILLILLQPFFVLSQNDTMVLRKQKNIIAWFHNKNQQINGISFGLFTHVKSNRNTVTNGVRVELLGLGLFNFFIWGDIDLKRNIGEKPFVEYSEKVNGISLSTFGTIGNLDLNGIGLNGFGCYVNKVNGLVFSGLSTNSTKGSGVFVSGGANFVDDFKGVQISGLFNYSYKGNGLQVCIISNKSRFYNGIQLSLYNKVKDGRVFQFGLINYIKDNPKGLRILPIMNMRFTKN